MPFQVLRDVRLQRAAALAQILAFFVLLMALAFTTASLAISNIGLTSRSQDGAVARNLALSATHLAIARLRQDSAFGAAAPFPQPLKAFIPGCTEQEACGYVTFDAANSQHMEASFNNLLSDSARPDGQGVTVPAYNAHILALGRYRGVEHRMETVLCVPNLPYALASTGTVGSSGGLLIGGLTSLDQVKNGFDAALTQLRPATLLSNAAGTRAIALTRGDAITGDAQAVGNVTGKKVARISGQVREGWDPVSIPRLHFADYDVAGKPGLSVLDTGAVVGPLALDGFARRSGNLDIGGGLKLDNAVLYVAGNLTIAQGISGTGAVIVEGDCTINGGGQMGSDSFTALLVQKDLKVVASAAQRAEFRGIVYTEGNFSGTYVDVVGSLVANSAGGSHSQVHNSRFLHLPVDQVVIAPPAPAYGPSIEAFFAGSLGGSSFGSVEVKLDQQYKGLFYDASQTPPDKVPAEVAADPRSIWKYVTEIRPRGSSSGYRSIKAFQEALVANGNGSVTVGDGNGGLVTLNLQERLDNLAWRVVTYRLPSFDWANYQPVTSTDPTPWTLDLSRLLKPEERIRTTLVRDR